MTADSIAHFWVLLIVLVLALLGGAGVVALVMEWRADVRGMRGIEGEATELEVVART